MKLNPLRSIDTAAGSSSLSLRFMMAFLVSVLSVGGVSVCKCSNFCFCFAVADKNVRQASTIVEMSTMPQSCCVDLADTESCVCRSS